MTAMSAAARNAGLRSHFGADRSSLSLATLYFALFQGDPFGSGVEPTSQGGYARAAKANDATLWGTIAGTATSVTTVAEIAWPAATGLWSITAPLTHWGVFSLSAGGVLWYGGLLSPSITVTGAGDQPRLPIGALTVSQGG